MALAYTIVAYSISYFSICFVTHTHTSLLSSVITCLLTSAYAMHALLQYFLRYAYAYFAHVLHRHFPLE
jgi:hypothetical protein